MTVTADPFEDEAEEFSRVYAVFREKGAFGRNNKDPPFYVCLLYTSDAADE